jgi:hypothetical protein
MPIAARGRLFRLNPASPSQQMTNEGNKEQDKEDVEDDLRYACRSHRDATEAEDSGHNRDDQES